MTSTLTPQLFYAKWRRIDLNERAVYQSHFNELCALLNHPTPTDYDHTGENFRVEKGATKSSGGEGFADVWFKGHFAWEYKGKHANLNKAYQQLQQYREALENPPLLVVCDVDSIQIHTNFTNSVNRVEIISLDDLLKPEKLNLLRQVFFNPEALRPSQTPENVTEQAAAYFSRLADQLRKGGHSIHTSAHFLIRLLFCLFAEDAGLFDTPVFTRLVQSFRNYPKTFGAQLDLLFQAMSTGGAFGFEPIKHFDGRLFDDAQVLELNSDGLEILYQVSKLDWSAIEPTIFGTLFERSLDPSKRSQLGAHYTSKDDILLIIEPVLMAPLRRQWAEVQVKAADLAEQRDTLKGTPRAKLQDKLAGLLMGFNDQIAHTRVLDPACGSGNFLYLALRELLNLQKEVIQHSGELGLGTFFPTVSPSQLRGVEINEYAHQLAQTAIQIGYIQWMQENGYGIPAEPILQPLDNIRNMDAILAYDADGNPCEPDWPEADVIIGNPPFLGGSKLRGELGDKYTETIYKLYGDRIPNASDLVCYWFEKARAMIEQGKVKRAGLLATQAIRGGANRSVLERIKQSGDIFWAQSDRNWILDGAIVHVSMIGFDHGQNKELFLDDKDVSNINSDLTHHADLTTAIPLHENMNNCFRTDEKGGPFDISEELARKMLEMNNPNGRPNSDVIRPYYNAFDVVQTWRHIWIVDFGELSEENAALYTAPFEYVKKVVKPVRDENRNEKERKYWWIHRRTAPDMRIAIENLKRFIVTPAVAKHRIFEWLSGTVIPDHAVYAFAREDDYFFGILHSRPHELWARATGTQLREAESGFRYTPTTTFETYPFPWPPGKEDQNNPRVQAIAQAARELVEKRDNVLKDGSTLTGLYNQRPTWLQMAHRKLDQAVFAAYGWPDDLSDEEILARLLALNLERSK
jgi:type II restriction/modification system DNA methylase subunit YeeA